MGEGHRLLGDYRGGGDMRVGSLVKNKEYGYIGIITEEYPITSHGRYLVRWADFDVYDYWSACELEVLCE